MSKAILSNNGTLKKLEFGVSPSRLFDCDNYLYICLR